MEGNHREPPALLQPLDRRREKCVQTLELLIDSDTQSLKRFRSGVDLHPIALALGISVLDDRPERIGRRDRLLFPRRADRSRDAPALAFISVLAQDAFDIFGRKR